MMMLRALPVLAGSVLLLAPLSRVAAGVGDTPLPAFSDGSPSHLVMIVPGVIKRGRLQTDFFCTVLGGAPTHVGVEIFAPNGRRMNNVSRGKGAILNVAHGDTVTFGTGGTAAYLESMVIPIGGVAQGSARIVASRLPVRCTVAVVDSAVTPPASVAKLGPGSFPAAGAGPVSIPLPRFSDGQSATHFLWLPGVVKRGTMQTDVFCTSLAASPIDVGLEIFAPDGTRQNDVRSGNGARVGLAPGATVTFGTSGTGSFLEDEILAIAGVAQGLGRVVSTSSDVSCAAFILDAGNIPPAAMARLAPVIVTPSVPTPSATPSGTPTPTPTVTLPPTVTFTPTALHTPTPRATATPIVGCTGDCSLDGTVTVDELVRGVNIALGNNAVSACFPFDRNKDGAVTVDELVRAVNIALNGCIPGGV